MFNHAAISQSHRKSTWIFSQFPPQPLQPVRKGTPLLVLLDQVLVAARLQNLHPVVKWLVLSTWGPPDQQLLESPVWRFPSWRKKIYAKKNRHGCMCCSCAEWSAWWACAHVLSHFCFDRLMLPVLERHALGSEVVLHGAGAHRIRSTVSKKPQTLRWFLESSTSSIGSIFHFPIFTIHHLPPPTPPSFFLVLWCVAARWSHPGMWSLWNVNQQSSRNEVKGPFS